MNFLKSDISTNSSSTSASPRQRNSTKSRRSNYIKKEKLKNEHVVAEKKTAIRERTSNLVPKKKKSSEKERERNSEIKAKLQYLAGRIPFVDKDLSRIRTLRLTKEYIKHLVRILQGDTIICPETGQERPLSKTDFKFVVDRELQTNNSYKDRAELELSTRSSSPAITESSSSGSHCQWLNRSTPINYQIVTSSDIPLPLMCANNMCTPNICNELMTKSNIYPAEFPLMTVGNFSPYNETINNGKWCPQDMLNMQMRSLESQPQTTCLITSPNHYKQQIVPSSRFNCNF